MIKEYYQNIVSGRQTRENLIALRRELKEERSRRAFAVLLDGNFTQLTRLLLDEDPKVRKNAALVLGEMESEDMLPVLFAAYQREDTLYIRSEYLKAISMLEYRPVVEELKKRLKQLQTAEAGAEEQKHIAREQRFLQQMILKYEKHQPHCFTGYNARKDVILVTNRCQREATAKQITRNRITMLAGGLRAERALIKDILEIRTYSELLFPLEVPALSVNQPGQAGRTLTSAVLTLLKELHQEGGAFLFRIELKGRIDPEKRGAYIHKIADGVEASSGGELINSVTDYEVEIRLLERKDGVFVPMVKLFTIPQKRFSYRKQFVAASIAPVNAALAVELAKPYLKEGAQILDPFCGVGTMLIERDIAVPAGTMYGIDLFGEAIEKARQNTQHVKKQIYYMNKDFFEFTHDYMFDEIITDMPQATSARSRDSLRQLYCDFFQKAGAHLKKDGVMILYAQDAGLISDMLGAHRQYKLERRFTLNEKNGAGVFIIQWRENKK